MTGYLLTLKDWFENRKLREKLFILGLACALLYFLFYFILFRSIDLEEAALEEEIKQLQNQATNWQTQINALKQLSASPLYKKWLNQRKSFQNLQGQYKFLLQASPTKQWQDVIKAIIASEDNISLVQIQNLPETPYRPENTNSAIYQQKLQIVIYSRYFDTINYLQKLEKILPNMHWDSMNYEVQQYPLAKVSMEFSILYEKGNG